MKPANDHDALDAAIAAAQGVTRPDDEIERYIVEEERRVRAENLDRSGLVLKDSARLAIIRDALTATHALDRVKGWHAKPNRRPILALAGSIGCGKSVAAGWLLAREGGRAVSAVELEGLAKRDLDRTLPALLRSRVLIVDDVGVCVDEAASRAAVHAVVDARQSSRAWTLLTTNLSAEALRAWLDPRTLSRLVESGAIAMATDRDIRQDARGAQ